jgi:polyhydroxyalkanoate synthesis regulator protein
MKKAYFVKSMISSLHTDYSSTMVKSFIDIEFDDDAKADDIHTAILETIIKKEDCRRGEITIESITVLN